MNRIKNLKPGSKVLICERCYKLKHYLTFEDLDKSKSDNNDKQHKGDKIENYTSVVKKIDPDKLVTEILKRISDRVHVFYVCVTLTLF